MLSNVLAKIKSALRRHGIVAVAVVAVVLTIPVYALFASRGDASVPAASYRLRMHNATYNLTAAVTEAEQTKGLGQRQSLAAKEGMLFWYADEGQRCFWMKDMHFAIDMLWVGHDKKVVKIVPKATPDSYPQTWCADAQYVIELSAGVAAKEGVRLGTQLDF
jgi:uncharacterized protein